jgi:hypothetical protein
LEQFKNLEKKNPKIPPKSNRKIAERGKIDTPNTQINYCSLFRLGTGTSIKSGGG